MAGATALQTTGHLFSTSFSSAAFAGGRCALRHYSGKNCLSVGPTRRWRVQALVMEPSDGAQGNLDDFVKRMEQTWLITKQPRPVQCRSCDAIGRVECPWCKGTGFFILGDNMLCEVPSRNTSCRVCFGQGTLACDDCKGTGFRAKWLGEPHKPKSTNG